MSKFNPVSSQIDLPAVEEETLKYWEENQIFEKSLKNRQGHERFVFYEGPPTANGKPGIHHVLARSFKDLVLRFRTMKGFLVERRAGWDTHGLPVEIEVEKELGLKGKQDILELKDNQFESVKFFNEKCRESVFRYIDDWVNLTKRIAFWINFEDAYITYKNDYIESVWWFISQVNQAGLLYKDYKVVPYCPRCGTSLSSHELATGYKDNIEDASVYPLFKITNVSNLQLKDELELIDGHKVEEIDGLDTYLVAWTTTPWTLPGNVGLAVKPEESYGLYLDQEKKRVLVGAVKLADYWIGQGTNIVQVAQILGNNLVSIHYEPLFPYLKKMVERDAFFVMPADFVSLDEGTGIVHTAVMYGVEDFELGKKYDLPMKHTVNVRGEFIPEVEAYSGQFVKSADKQIIEDLKKKDLLYKSGTIKHTYPFCWRCATPLLYYALDTWFIKTTQVKNKLLEDNQKINWVPKTIKNGRMGNWLESLIDWNISRNRFWGTPLPIWVCQNSHIKVIGSREEIQSLGGKVPEDLHKPFIDEVELKCPDCGQAMKRIPDVADVWMDSGAMPFAQWHYPFENKEIFEEWYPADYIVEAIDQTRGWFFTLMAEAMLLKKEPPAPFKNTIVTGFLLDGKGQKMSKSKGNVVDPWEVIKAVGADTVRWYMYTGAPVGGNYLFSKELVQEKYRRFTLILWNSYKFFIDYAILADYTPSADLEKITEKLSVLDRWILAKTMKLISLVNSKLEKYDPTSASRAIEDFVVNDLSTWYIRRSRDRVGPLADKEDEQIFLTTLYRVLVELNKLTAPFIPFLAEEMYRNLTGEESVHLASYPEADKSLIDEQLILDMVFVRDLVEVGHAQRKETGIKLRQPLSKFTYYAPVKLSSQLEKILADELNVKSVEYKHTSKEELKGEMDTKITPQLQIEGEARELIRQVQQLRKEAGLTLKDKVKITAPMIPQEENLKQLVLKQTNAVDISEGEKVAIEIVQ
ncbi:MAG: isoleucine--tRNA ligase [Patescibacteria group bacterium]|nr:isoleucine--tRNA ligase [Patescibacteria group bacterium]